MKNLNYDFNVIDFESKHEQDYYQSCGSFSDGDFDARIGIEPSEENWLSVDYREGYLFGIEQKFNEKFALFD